MRRQQSRNLHRFFFALRPGIVTARRTDMFAETVAGGASRIRPEHQHMTLAITNDHQYYPHELEERLRRAGDTVVAAPFALLLNHLVGSYSSVALRPRIRAPQLMALQRAIRTAMRANAVEMRVDYRFSPHETLLYRKGSPFHRPVEGFRWDVTHFHLVHSAVGQTRHTILRSWALGDAPEEQPQFNF